MELELRTDLGVADLRITLQQRLRAHHHPGDAETALRGLFLDESLLDRCRIAERAQAFQCRDLPSGKKQNRCHAGEGGSPIDQHRTSSALAEATAELGCVELQVIPQDVEQRSLRIRIDGVSLSIDGQVNHARASGPGVRTRRLPATAADCRSARARTRAMTRAGSPRACWRSRA